MTPEIRPDRLEDQTYQSAVNVMEAPDAEEAHRRNPLFDKLVNTPPGRKVVAAMATMAMGGALAPAAAAKAEASPGPGTTVTHEDTDLSLDFGRASASAEDIAQGKVTVLARVRAKGSPREIRTNPRCYTERDTFWNSGVGANGNRYWFLDDRDSKLCPDGNGGWVRVECHNPARPNVNNRPPERRIVEGRVIVANSFKAKVKAKAKSHVAVHVVRECGEAFASAKAKAVAKIRLRKAIRAEGSRATIRLMEKAKARALTRAEAEAEVTCGPGGGEENLPPTTEIFAPEHMFTSGTAAICEIENDPDGTIAAREFTANRGSYVSGVYPGNDPNEFCRTYRAPSTTGEVTVGINVTDNDGASDSDQRSFPVVEDQF